MHHQLCGIVHRLLVERNIHAVIRKLQATGLAAFMLSFGLDHNNNTIGVNLPP
jgi:hypothetical protein